MLYYLMKSQKCLECGQTIEGFSLRDLKYRMFMHSIKHRKEQEKTTEETKTENESM